MYINSVLEKCKEENYPMSRMGIYNAGIKYGFLTGKDEKNRWIFDKEKFLDWLNNKVNRTKVPEGWVTLNELKDIVNISIAQCYILSKNEKSGAKKFNVSNKSGIMHEVIYVDPERIKEIIDECNKNHKYDWGETNGNN